MSAFALYSICKAFGGRDSEIEITNAATIIFMVFLAIKLILLTPSIKNCCNYVLAMVADVIHKMRGALDVHSIRDHKLATELTVKKVRFASGGMYALLCLFVLVVFGR